jgi:hypothetical protein
MMLRGWVGVAIASGAITPAGTVRYGCALRLIAADNAICCRSPTHTKTFSLLPEGYSLTKLEPMQHRGGERVSRDSPLRWLAVQPSVEDDRGRSSVGNSVPLVGLTE